MKRIFNRIIIVICMLLVIPVSALAWTPPAGWDNWNAALGAVSTSIIPGTDATYDLGSTGSNWRSAYFSTSITVDSAFWMGIGSGAGRIVWTDAATDIVAVMGANFGIGTVTPATLLHVYNSVASPDKVAIFESSDAKARIEIKDSTASVYVNIANSGTIMSLGFTDGLDLNNLNIQSDGNVGIGDTSPDDLLDITGGALRIQAQADDFAIVNTTSLGLLKFFGDDDTASADEIGGQIEVIATGTWTDGAEDAKMVLNAVNNGTLNSNQLVLKTDGGVSSGGILTGGVGSISKAAAYTIGTDDSDEAYGYTVYVTAAATITLPAVADGMNGCVYSTTAAAVSLDTNASDKFVLFNGAALDDGDKVTSASGAGDYICYAYYSADGWATWGRSGVWTDGGP